MNFSSICYNIAGLYACILNPSEFWRFQSVQELELTENFKVTVMYEYLSNDFTKLSDYEDHFFCIEFFRDKTYIGSFILERKFDRIVTGNLADPNMSISEKLEILDKLKPTLREKIANYSLSKKLTREELETISLKSEELTSLVKDNIQRKLV